MEFWNADKAYVREAWRKADPTLSGIAGKVAVNLNLGSNVVHSVAIKSSI